MNNISRKLTDYILKKGMIEEESYDVYQYGLQCLIELSASTICSFVIAISLGMFVECIFFYLFFIPLRTYGGGMHMNTYLACFFTSSLILASTLLLVKYLTVPVLVSFLIYLISAIMIKLIGPVNHPNREVNSEENRIFMKRTNFTLLISFFIALVLMRMNFPTYLFLEAIVFVVFLVTTLVGKMKYQSNIS